MNKSTSLKAGFPLKPLCLVFFGATLWPEMELLVPSLPTMRVFFSVSEGEIQQLLSSNFLGFLCGILLAGSLCDSYGRKKVSLWGMFFFLLSSLAAALAPDFFSMILARFLQGLTMTAPIIGGMTLLLEHTSGAQQIFWLSISSATITLCMAVAPLLGSSINAHYGFRGNLWTIFILALIGTIPLILWVPESMRKDKQTALRLGSIVRDYWQLIRYPQFMSMALLIAAMPAAYWIYTGVSSLYLVDYLNVDPALFGQYQMPIVGTFAVLSMGMGSIHKKINLKTCLLIGFLAMSLGATLFFSLSLGGLEHPLMMTVSMVLFVAGMVPTNSLLFPMALNRLPAELQGKAQSLIQALRLLLASLGTIILGFTYQGPFMPVALVLILLFAFSNVLLWRVRKELSPSHEGIIIGSH
jgi:DHA1 family bicyclomycin/chloramphenicol resistance-like MFS transporter